MQFQLINVAHLGPALVVQREHRHGGLHGDTRTGVGASEIDCCKIWDLFGNSALTVGCMRIDTWCTTHNLGVQVKRHQAFWNAKMDGAKPTNSTSCVCFFLHVRPHWANKQSEAIINASSCCSQSRPLLPQEVHHWLLLNGFVGRQNCQATRDCSCGQRPSSHQNLFANCFCQ